VECATTFAPNAARAAMDRAVAMPKNDRWVRIASSECAGRPNAPDGRTAVRRSSSGPGLSRAAPIRADDGNPDEAGRDKSEGQQETAEIHRSRPGARSRRGQGEAGIDGRRAAAAGGIDGKVVVDLAGRPVHG